jgi:hypothetical protein
MAGTGPAMTTCGGTHGWVREIRARGTTKTGLACHRDTAAFRLTSRFGQLYLAQPLERSSNQMRNKITQLIIVVVPRHIAGGG